MTIFSIEEDRKVKKAQYQQCNYLQLQTCADDKKIKDVQLAIFNSSLGISIKFDDKCSSCLVLLFQCFSTKKALIYCLMIIYLKLSVSQN